MRNSRNVDFLVSSKICMLLAFSGYNQFSENQNLFSLASGFLCRRITNLEQLSSNSITRQMEKLSCFALTISFFLRIMRNFLKITKNATSFSSWFILRHFHIFIKKFLFLEVLLILGPNLHGVVSPFNVQRVSKMIFHSSLKSLSFPL